MAPKLVNIGGAGSNQNTVYAHQHTTISALFDAGPIVCATAAPSTTPCAPSRLTTRTATSPKPKRASSRPASFVPLSSTSHAREPERFTAAQRPASLAEIDDEMESLERLIQVVENNLVDADEPANEPAAEAESKYAHRSHDHPQHESLPYVQNSFARHPNKADHSLLSL